MKTLGAADVTRSNWSTFWWILGTVFMPLTIPYLLSSLLNQLRTLKNRDYLRDKIVFITGASSGLGEAMAHTFFMAGCKVVLAARRKEELERVRADLHEIQTTTPTHPPMILTLDLTDINSLPDKIIEVENSIGSIDILINNGGVSIRADILSTTMDVDIKVMLVNYFGGVALTKAVLPTMIKRQNGHIVCVGSVQGKFSLPHRSSYSASKHAMQAFCDSLRAEMAENNIKVLCVSPGYINTALSLNALTGSGRAYGLTDQATSTGASPESVAESIRQAIISEEKDVIIAPFMPKLAYWLRFLLPDIYFWAMKRRAQKITQNKTA